jgi:hypothetical protein
MVNKGYRLGTMGRGEEAIVTYKLIVHRFADSIEPEITKIVESAKENLKAFGDSDMPAS